MVALHDIEDPTLAAADEALEAGQDRKRRGYMGMSGVGHECSRKVWYDFRWISEIEFDAATLKRFADGHLSEDIQAERLRAVEGIELLTHDADGKQFAIVDDTGHLRGHTDGKILGLLQAPKTWHVWEHKCSSKMNELIKFKTDLGEKNALKKWSIIYYTQAQLYMHYTGFSRHYLTCAEPGTRKSISVRTNYDCEFALRAISRAQSIVKADAPPARIANSSTFYLCRFCDHQKVCWGSALPPRHCRTCVMASPEDAGQWSCGLGIQEPLGIDTQREGCPCHLYLPPLVGGVQVDACGNGAAFEWIEYRRPDGTIWRDEGP